MVNHNSDFYSPNIYGKGKRRIDNVLAYTIERFRDPINLSMIADFACMSVPAFCSYFKRQTGVSFINFVINLRLHYACNLLRTTDAQIIKVAIESGFNTSSNFYKHFVKVHIISPSEYRKRYSNGIKKISNWQIADWDKLISIS